MLAAEPAVDGAGAAVAVDTVPSLGAAAAAAGRLALGDVAAGAVGVAAGDAVAGCVALGRRATAPPRHRNAHVRSSSPGSNALSSEASHLACSGAPED